MSAVQRGPQDEQVLGWFDFHPATMTTGPLHAGIRAAFKLLAHDLLTNLPPGADRTLALRKLQEAMWAANSCIANAEPGPDG
jgi:hypothetical protein